MLVVLYQRLFSSFDYLELYRELEPFYEKKRYRFKMATAGERNKVMKLFWIWKKATIPL